MWRPLAVAQDAAGEVEPHGRTRDCRHAGGMILTEYRLHFAKDGDHWRCVEFPEPLMLPSERYRVGERTFGSLDEALWHPEARGLAPRQ